MITLHRLIAQAVWPLAASVWALVAALIALVAILRVKKKLESRPSAQTNAACNSILDSLVRGELQYRDALVQLRRLPAARVRASFEAISTGNKSPAPERAAALGKLCEDSRTGCLVALQAGPESPRTSDTEPFQRNLVERNPATSASFGLCGASRSG